MLTKDQILPFLDTVIRSYSSPTKYASISTCHRLIALTLLRVHYRKDAPQSIRHTFEGFPFSPETIRRAVKDGFDMGVIERAEGGDRRQKRVQASQLLVDNFEERHVESTD